MILPLPSGEKLSLRRVVIKLGTKQITDTRQLNEENIERLIDEVMRLRQQGVQCVLVVSGAIGMARYAMGMGEREFTLAEKQALAGVGQGLLMSFFAEKFQKRKTWIGQVLLTHYIFDNRKTYLNARNTLNTMLEMGIIPVINENDSVATDEIQFGDNDRLGAYVSVMVGADLYIMLTDIDGLYAYFGTPQQRLIPVVRGIQQVARYAQKQQENFSRGGMITKLQAAKITTTAGIPAVIANGFRPGVLEEIFGGLQTGTIFLPSGKTINYRKRWISSKKMKGKLVVDQGAKQALLKHKSLLAAGIVAVEGDFKEGDTVLVVGPEGEEIGLGIVNYESREIEKIKGRKSEEIAILLGKNKVNTVIHCDNMVLYGEEEYGSYSGD
ncbi:glutamate 5-kinase [Thermospira aquatica]|uniref:Glutamate 5-kinase n=1 Tax=Thermospira aquatica TaxID=2828656 RepID=A0AAX3BAJ1_9SPIR|nr:glutamate 5-kinase [Thermospira aquatica]URA09284.1 glutamate 5-kinase [Thermospira aquatica]